MPRGTRVTAPRTTATLPATSIPTPRTLTDNKPLPKLIVFDLDYTLWPFWVDTHVSPPLKGTPDHGLTVRDAYGGNYGFYPEVSGLLHSLRERGIPIGIASRTGTPDLARQMLNLLTVPGTPAEEGRGPAEQGGPRKAIHMLDFQEIYPGSKTTHFERLRKKTGVPYEEMLFFDDEARNRNVETLGVVMYLIRNGVSRAEFDKGVESWRQRNGRTEEEA